MVGPDPALPLPDAEELGRHLDLQVLLHPHLAGKADAVALLAAAQVAALGGEHRAPAIEDAQGAHPATPLPAAGGGDEELLLGQRAEQRAPRRDGEVLVGVVVDPDRDLTGGDEALFRVEEDDDEGQDDAGKPGDPEQDGAQSARAGCRRRP